MPATRLVPVILFSATFVSSLTVAGNPMEVIPQMVPESRYVSLSTEPTAAQWDVMQSVITVAIPKSAETVGDALQHILKSYGYQLDDGDDDSLAFYVLLTRRVPEPHRNLGPITLRDALDVLGGASFEVIINPVLRTVGYRLKPEFQTYISDAAATEAKSAWLSLLDDPVPAVIQGYGPVKPCDTLSSIVVRLGMADLTLDQALVHVFRSNTQAFASGNMNHLLVGEYLSIPPIDDPLSPAAASRLVDEQYRAWQLREVQP